MVWDQAFPDPILEPGEIASGHAIMFDSSHFPNQQSVTITADVWDWSGGHRSYQGSAPVQNQSVLYGRYDQEIEFLHPNGNGWLTAPGGDETAFRALPSSASRLPAMHYDVIVENTRMGWTAGDFGLDSMIGNVIDIHTHGNEHFMWSDSNDWWYVYAGGSPATTDIYGTVAGPPADSIALIDYREIANGPGSPLPPFNSGSPPISLAMLSTCDAGVDNTFAEGLLYPYGNMYAGVSDYPEDQSCIGLAIPFQSDQNAFTNEAFWKALKNRKTADEARKKAFQAHDGDDKPELATEFMHVWGDFYTRLKSVYTGDSSQQSALDWFRSI